MVTFQIAWEPKKDGKNYTVYLEGSRGQRVGKIFRAKSVKEARRLIDIHHGATTMTNPRHTSSSRLMAASTESLPTKDQILAEINHIWSQMQQQKPKSKGYRKNLAKMEILHQALIEGRYASMFSNPRPKKRPTTGPGKKRPTTRPGKKRPTTGPGSARFPYLVTFRTPSGKTLKWLRYAANLGIAEQSAAAAVRNEYGGGGYVISVVRQTGG